LINLPKGTVLKIGQQAQVEITGLRNPCAQLESIQTGLMKAVLDKDEDGNLIRKSGIMGIVLEGGPINVNDEIDVVFPPQPHIKLERV
jgi:MOSC domain-containing protein YiiM